MPKAGFIVTRVSFLILAASMLGAAMLAAPAAGQTSTCSGKCFAVAVSPSNPVAGESASFAFAITNEASTQRLGSVQISAPAGFVITGASGAASFTSSSALFLNLSLAPSATTTLTLTAAATCSGGTYQWGIEAKQSNDFNGSGNDFLLDPASAGNLSGSVTGMCSLAFTTDGEPANTAANAVITSAFDSKGGPVKVEVLDGSRQLATASSAEVSVAIGPNSGSGTLSGTVMVPASGGIASFSDLSINQPGGYTLVATSPGITSATSDGFTIFTSFQPCPSNTACSASASSATTSGSVTTSSAAPGDFIAASIGGVSFSCGGTYQPVSDAFGFAVFGAAGNPLSTSLTVSLEIDKSLVQSSGHPGASSWQICYAAVSSFTALPGTSGTITIGGVTYNTGLLPDCTSTQGAPCVQARNKDNAGDVVVTFLAFGDPYGRG
jgi:hypothetical protein